MCIPTYFLTRGTEINSKDLNLNSCFFLCAAFFSHKFTKEETFFAESLAKSVAYSATGDLKNFD